MVVGWGSFLYNTLQARVLEPMIILELFSFPSNVYHMCVWARILLTYIFRCAHNKRRRRSLIILPVKLKQVYEEIVDT
jgi:hypothetical protein